jgi:hypothetical protein
MTTERAASNCRSLRQILKAATPPMMMILRDFANG